ncbi:PD-(D/E)XK motif protein [Diaphorobacter sp. HDW4B]|uniref:PD-(D/E)XK motif protein n=1 Tax=Diaphorobacter sp. HDW4B TaxID=2714925 RepID=UPI00140DC705|nr:PD-(D/E)XK motif protein [Diaphorobacter sp. HDW4B]QIL69090.1 PD-(D/E)XK motif protein [Diaphorobacter sp. HDW4B]
MLEHSPWDDLTIPDSDYNVLLVDEMDAVPCHWGRSATGACLFIVELQGDFAERMRRKLIHVRGIKLDLQVRPQGVQHLVFELQRDGDRDLFLNFCRALSSSLASARNSDVAFAMAWEHLRRWKHFLSGSMHQLSPEAVRGLYAELLFLCDRIRNSGDSLAAVDSWKGPMRGQHDFVYGNKAVEIKSLMGTARNSVRISSEDQLESLNETLYLRIYALRVEDGKSEGVSLNRLVDLVRAQIDDASALDDFDGKLVEQKYQPLPAYDEPRFSEREVRTYRVDGEFPRIARSRLSPMLCNVAYDVKLEGIEEHACNESELHGDK